MPLYLDSWENFLRYRYQITFHVSCMTSRLSTLVKRQIFLWLNFIIDFLGMTSFQSKPRHKKHYHFRIYYTSRALFLVQLIYYTFQLLNKIWRLLLLLSVSMGSIQRLFLSHKQTFSGNDVCEKHSLIADDIRLNYSSIACVNNSFHRLIVLTNWFAKRWSACKLLSSF